MWSIPTRNQPEPDDSKPKLPEQSFHNCARNQTGWLSVKQLVVYHSLILVFKIKQEGKPAYLREKFKNKFAYQTRQATGNCFVQKETPQSEKTRKAFVYKSTILWNSLPPQIRKIEKIEKFKSMLKKWVKENTPV